MVPTDLTSETSSVMALVWPSFHVMATGVVVPAASRESVPKVNVSVDAEVPFIGEIVSVHCWGVAVLVQTNSRVLSVPVATLTLALAVSTCPSLALAGNLRAKLAVVVALESERNPKLSTRMDVGFAAISTAPVSSAGHPCTKLPFLSVRKA